MTQCRCMAPPFLRRDFDTSVIGVDMINSRYGDVSLDTCRCCGAMWLCYQVEYEAFTESGRHFRGLVSHEALTGLTAETAAAVLADLPWYIRGGSYFRTPGERSAGPPHVDL